MNNLVRILCVDDSLSVQQMVVFILKKAGFEPVVANNGREGIEKAKTLQPGLILMDLMMPDISGIQAIKQIKTDPICQHIPILVLSAYGTQKIIDQALEAGAAAFLDKTIFPDKLIQEIKSHLKQDEPSA
jgi:CheY-like chemotaxis protein